MSVFVLLLAGCLWWWGGAPAWAGVKHVFERSFCPEGAGVGQCKKPIGVAVNDETHDVYVADSANDRVEEFDAGGVYVGEFNGSGLLVGEGGAAGSGGLGSEEETGEFSEPTQVAVDNSTGLSRGDVYVVDFNHNVIDKFSGSGAYVGQLIGTTCESPGKAAEPVACPKSGTIRHFKTLEGVAVDPSGIVWTIEHEGDIDSFSGGQPNVPLTSMSTLFGGGLRPGVGIDARGGIYMKWRPTAKISSSGEITINPFCGTFEESSNSVAVDAGQADVYVDDFDRIAECDTNGNLIEGFGVGHLTGSQGVAVDASGGESASGTVYATSSNAAGGVVVFPAVAFPTATVGEPTDQLPSSVTLNGMVNPEGHAVTSCFFEYDVVPYEGGEPPHPEPPAHRVACEPGVASIGSGTAGVPVKAHLEGLASETRYYYRLVAGNAAGSGESCRAKQRCQTFFTGPVLGGEYVTDVTADSVTLHGPVDPNGADTHYYFEYGLTTAYGAFVPLGPPGADLGSMKGVQAIAVHLQGLPAATIFHYRLVAEQAGMLFEEPDRVFMTQPGGVTGGFSLPDGRAWELVSPADKKGALVEFFPGYGVVLQAARDGSGISYRAFGQLGEDPQGKGPLSYVLSRRSGGGWRSRDLTLPDRLPPEGEEPAKLNGGPEYTLFSPSLLETIVEPHRFTPPLTAGVTERTLYRGDIGDMGEESFMALVTAENTPSGTKIATESPEPMRVYLATPDLSHLVLRSPVALKEEPYSEYYEWSGGQLLRVGVLPGGTAYTGQMSVAGADGELGSAQRAISSDGRWVAWTPGDPYNTPNVPLYVRDMIAEETLKVGGADPRYQTMSSDGQKIFYLEGGDLWEFETASATPHDLTENHQAGEANAGVLEAVSNVSEDGSSVYFVAEGALAGGAEKGQPNLYLLRESAGTWTIDYIATLSREDEKSWYQPSFAAGTSAPGLDGVSSRVSPDGRYLAFMSQRSLTGYDNHDAISGQPDEEVFLYDAVSQHLICASCDPTGARPVGVLDESQHEPLVDRFGLWSARLSSADHRLAGNLPGWDEGNHSRAMYQPRYLSDSGRLFFNSPDGLVPQATNGVEDVYEYEPQQVGDCAASSASFNESRNGCISLISSGISGAESAFFDASETGDDAFFITAAKLASEDFDTSYDVYDAHVCTSAIPCRILVERPPECDTGDGCKGPPTPQPEIFGPPPTATFSGQGNVTPTNVTAHKHLTATQKMARALKACQKKKNKHQRRLCAQHAKRRYTAKRTHRTRPNTGRRS